MHPLAYARGSVTLAESTRLLPSRDRQGAVSSEIPKTFKHPGTKPAAGLILSGCNPAETGFLQPRNLLVTCARASSSLHASLSPLPRPIVRRARRMLSPFLKGSSTRAARRSEEHTSELQS